MLNVRFYQDLPSEMPLGNVGKVPDRVNWTMQRAQKHALQKSLTRMVLEQRCVADIAKQHLDLFLPRYLLHLRQ